VKKLSILQDFSDDRFHCEVDCLLKTKHNNIVRFLGYCADTQGELVEHKGRKIMAEVRQRFLCFEYVPNRSLRHYLKGTKFATLLLRNVIIKSLTFSRYIYSEHFLDISPQILFIL
jgi:serine/threonine protein kinase